LGSRTSSFDSETPVLETCSVDGVTPGQITGVLSEFVGAQTQVPPMWSAAKVGGKPLYKYARKGRVVPRTPREVFITSITPLAIDIPEVTFNVVCSKGTYIRTLADDIGLRLGCGAHLVALERIRIGEYTVEDAVTIEELISFKRSLLNA
jgi:tRNA pseudouridine55 synthase